MSVDPRMKRNTKAQWMNLQRNSSFVNRIRFPLLCEKSGAILLVLVGLTAGRPAVRRNSGRFRNFQIRLSTDRVVRFSMEFNKGTVLL